MIWIHTYGIGKFGRKIRKSIHDSEQKALDSQKVLGGTVERFHSDEDVATNNYHAANALRQEISDVIDDSSKQDPALYGSPEWDAKKLKACSMVNQIIEEGDY